MTDQVPQQVDGPQESALLPIDDNARAALALLGHAYDCALSTGAAPWDFALEIGELCAAGLTVTDLRWLVVKGLIEHGSETTAYGDLHRSFTRSSGFNFLATTCVVLTKKGVAFACRAGRGSASNVAKPTHTETGKLRPEGEFRSLVIPARLQAALKPRWNPMRRELSLGGSLVKRFLVPARNQEAILVAFQEEGWPECIDDPLIGDHGIDLKNRLNDVVFRLNRSQIQPLIRFHTNGNGNGIRWSLCAREGVRPRRRVARKAPTMG